MGADIFEHFLVPLLTENELDVALRVETPEDESMLLLGQMEPTEHLIILLLYYRIYLFSSQFSLN